MVTQLYLSPIKKVVRCTRKTVSKSSPTASLFSEGDERRTLANIPLPSKLNPRV